MAPNKMTQSFEKSVKGGTKIKVNAYAALYLNSWTNVQIIACRAKVEIRRTYPRRDSCRRSGRCRSLQDHDASSTGLDMDDRIQGINHRPLDDKRRRAKYDTQVPGRPAIETCHQQFLRWYVPTFALRFWAIYLKCHCVCEHEMIWF